MFNPLPRPRSVHARRLCRAAAVAAALLGTVPVLLIALPSPARAVDPPPTLDDTPDLQTLLHATPEEWTVIGPKLDQISALRAALAVSPDAPPPPARTTPKIFDSPLGGTSLDAPTMGGRFGRGRQSPFDPANAPGAHSRSLLGALAGALGRAAFGGIQPDQANMLQTELTDLNALLKDKSTTDVQLRDKLAELRAARAKTTRDLTDAEKDLLPLLTTDQIATLVAMDELD